MNPEIPHLERILLLAVLITGALLIVAATPLQDDGNFELFPGAEASRGTDDSQFRMSIGDANPQPNGEHWSIVVTFEEDTGGQWEKTAENVNVQVIFFNNSEENIIQNITWPNAQGDTYIYLAYDLADGNYTIRAKVPGADMDWKKEVVQVPFTSRPPKAVANILVDDILVKEATVILDREQEANVLLDASDSWDPDEGQTDLINYTWTIGNTVIASTDPTLLWVFTEAGDYLVTLRTNDAILPELYSEDTVLVHVEEIDYLPDLRVDISSNVDSVIIGNPINITVTIRNTGNNDVSDFLVNYIDRNGVFRFQTIGLVQYGSTRIITFEYTPVFLGPNRINVLVDPVDAHEEFDEDNNDDFFDIDVLSVPEPDIIIEHLTADGSFEVDGLTFITIVIVNNGTIDALNVKTTLFINNELMLDEYVESMGAGERATVNYTWLPKFAGTFNAHFTIWVENVIHGDRTIEAIEITPSVTKDPEDPDGIPPVFYAAAAGSIILLIIGAISIAGVENSKYRILGSVFVAPLYTRLKKEDTLRHVVRARVYEHIISHPGDSYAHILNTLDLKNGTLVHHLRTLERERYVKSKKDGKYKRFYPWGTKVGERDPRFLTDIQMEIVDIIKSSPGVSQANIANTLSKSRQSINYQIKILSEANLINVIKHGITTRCYVQET